MYKDNVVNYFLNLGRSNYFENNFKDFLKAINFTYNVPSIHIAGTNGKGSTSNFIYHIYKNDGYKIGYYYSPYLYFPLENVLINDENIKEEKLEEYIKKYDSLIKKFSLSEFEVETFFALLYLQENKVDIAIIECGMGGEYDATNVFNPILSIITSIGIEHCDFLGDSYSEIASHKAGIIKKYVPVLIGQNFDEDALSVISKKAKQCESEVINPIHIIVNSMDEFTSNISFEKFFINLDVNFSSQFLIDDLEIALTAIMELNNKFSVKKESIIKGIKDKIHPARFEILSKNPLIICDGAHNPEGINTLNKNIRMINFSKPFHIIFASFRDKNVNTILSILSAITDDITITTFDHPRARKKDEYCLYLEEYKFDEDYIHAIKEVINKYGNDAILITGSLAFAGLVSKQFKEGKI